MKPVGKHGKNPVVKIVIMVLVAELAGAVGSLFTFPAIGTWYAALNKPFFSPPNWVFGPVWVILYALMGIAAGLVWNAKTKKGVAKTARIDAMAAFGVQLGLNVIWSVIFFGLRAPFYAFIEIIALWTAIAATIIVFGRISKTSAMLLMPYVLWVSFAAFLNLSIWMLNV